MLVAYPESMIDLQEVKENDVFTASKESGKVIYSHKIADPMADANAKSIMGAYCVIKNKRGEFLTTLSKEDIAKHRRVAQTDNIWSSWFKEMVLKTVIKKACKYHFDDIFEGMNEIDNEDIDLSRSVVSVEVEPEKIAEVIKKIESIKILADLQEYYKGLASEFIKNDDIFEAYNAQKEICKATK
jgi:recombinational DNA repair protein RecT